MKYVVCGRSAAPSAIVSRRVRAERGGGFPSTTAAGSSQGQAEGEAGRQADHGPQGVDTQEREAGGEEDREEGGAEGLDGRQAR